MRKSEFQNKPITNAYRVALWLFIAVLGLTVLMNIPIRPDINIGRAGVGSVKPSIFQWYAIDADDYLVIKRLGEYYRNEKDPHSAKDRYTKVKYTTYAIQIRDDDHETATIAVQVKGDLADKLDEYQTIDLYGTMGQIKPQFQDAFETSYGRKIHVCLNDKDSGLISRWLGSIILIAVMIFLIHISNNLKHGRPVFNPSPNHKKKMKIYGDIES